MFQWFYKIVLLLVTFSFFISASEIDIGECHNTFFDEYDTYVQAREINLPQQAIQIDQFGLCDLYSNEQLLTHIHTLQFFDTSEKPTCIVFQKLYLRNSVWRI